MQAYFHAEIPMKLFQSKFVFRKTYFQEVLSD